MSSRRAFAVLGVAMVLLAWACSGSDPELTAGPATDGGTESAAPPESDATVQVALDASDASGSCGIPGNLLLNGSFETTSPTGNILSWDTSGTLVRHVGGADDCEAWAEITSTQDDDYLQHDFTLPTSADAGTQYEIGVSLRSLDGITDPIDIELRVVGEGYENASSQSIAFSPAWTRVFVQLGQSDVGQTLRVVLHPLHPRRLGVDRVYAITL